MADNLYAGTSVQIYPSGAATLSKPHSDVQGFLDYVGRFNAVNFHAKDDDVREWRFNKEYDNWQDRLGMDSIKVLYHHGHTGMAADGRFVAGMGRTWDNTLQASSSRMSFGDQRLRYLLIHGCDSLMMHFGQNPYRTWNASNKGARMIFGFDGLTYDLDGQGTGFFREWNTGKSFSQSWQDAALATYTDHRPSSTACGATAQEAQDRLWNERLFFGDAVSDNWYWWRWAGPAPLEVNLDIPLPHVPGLNLELERRPSDLDTAARLAARFDVRPFVVQAVSPFAEASRQSPEVLATRRLTLHSDGAYEIFLAAPAAATATADLRRIKAAADAVVQNMELGLDLVFDGMTATHHAGASRDGERAEVAIRDYTAHYRQLHEGIPAVRGGDGHLRVTLDAAGTLCSLTDRTVAIARAVEGTPPERGGTYGSERSGSQGKHAVEHGLDDADAALRRQLACDGRHEHKVAIVPNSTDVGYRFDRSRAVPVARRVVEIRTGDYAFRKVIEIVL